MAANINYWKSRENSNVDVSRVVCVYKDRMAIVAIKIVLVKFSEKEQRADMSAKN